MVKRSELYTILIISKKSQFQLISIKSFSPAITFWNTIHKFHLGPPNSCFRYGASSGRSAWSPHRKHCYSEQKKTSFQLIRCELNLKMMLNLINNWNRYSNLSLGSISGAGNYFRPRATLCVHMCLAGQISVKKH